MLGDLGMDAIKTPFKAPNANSVAERYVLSARTECWNHILVFGMDHLYRVLKTHQKYYNRHRPHQGIGNTIPSMSGMSSKMVKSEDVYASMVHREKFLGGLLNSYYRMVA